MALGAAAQTQELRLTPVADATIFAEQTGGTAYDAMADGQGGNLWSGTLVAGVVRRSLIRFDLGAIPPGSVIREVTLSLAQIRARGDHLHGLHRITEAWTEGPANGGDAGIGAAATAGDVTWSHRSWPAMPWAQRGGSVVGTPSSSVFIGPAPSTTVFPSSPALVADVQGWVQQPGSNQGWMLIGVEGPEANAKRFGSRNNGEAVARPLLVVRWDPPVPASADVPLPPWALALGAAMLGGALWARGRRG
jgi:hypothetical protein